MLAFAPMKVVLAGGSGQVGRALARAYRERDWQVTTIGRSRTNAVQIAWDATVARSHAAIERIGNTVTVRDLGSDAGSIVNGSPLEGEAVLVAGDELVIGHTPFRLEERKSAALVAVQAAPAAVAAAAAPA